MNPKWDQVDQSNTNADQEGSSQQRVIPDIRLEHARIGDTCADDEAGKEIEIGEKGGPGPGAEPIEVAEREGDGQIGGWRNIEKTRAKDCTD